jgi:virginiamycin B lyase
MAAAAVSAAALDDVCPSHPMAGRVMDASGAHVGGAWVTTWADARVQRTVYADAEGRFDVSLPDGDSVFFRVTAAGYDTFRAVLRRRDEVPSAVVLRRSPLGDRIGASYLAALPEGEEKRRFALDCTGCHRADERVMYPGGRARTAAEWSAAVTRMLGYAGASTRFPVIAAGRDPAATGAWLARHVPAREALRDVPLPPPSPATLTEYPHPIPTDLPHDVAVAGEGVVVTGMLSHRMFTLDPRTGEFREVAIPLERANPRAVEVDADGVWWVLFGAPQRVGAYTPRTGTWRTWDLGMYPHSIGRDARGRVWFNGHFTRDPELVGFLDSATGRTTTFAVPSTPALREGAGPVPYDLRIAPDGTVWGSELHGNRIFRFDPATERFAVFPLPQAHSGPRRMDFDAAGGLWVAEYAANHLTRFDPRTGRFARHRLPVPDALPYVARADRRRGTVWVGTGAADAVFRFHPASGRWDTYPLPTRGALIRHLDVDERTGAVWAAYGAAPGVPPRIVRIEPAAH